jgi:hypothetical protein
MAERPLTLSPDELDTLTTIVVRHAGLASTVHVQVRRLGTDVWPGGGEEDAWAGGRPVSPRGAASRAQEGR